MIIPPDGPLSNNVLHKVLNKWTSLGRRQTGAGLSAPVSRCTRCVKPIIAPLVLAPADSRPTQAHNRALPQPAPPGVSDARLRGQAPSPMSHLGANL